MAKDSGRQLATDKAMRIVDAMRSSVARRGVAGSTFDHVAREAGVSRGLLHYYFGSKERLLVEVARRDAEVRFVLMATHINRANTADELVSHWVRSLHATVKHEPEFVVLLLELYTLAQRTPEIADELSSVMQGMTTAFAARMEMLEAEGKIVLAAPAEKIADVFLGLGYGMSLRLLADPSRDMTAAIEVAAVAARSLLRDADGAAGGASAASGTGEPGT